MKAMINMQQQFVNICSTGETRKWKNMLKKFLQILNNDTVNLQVIMTYYNNMRCMFDFFNEPYVVPRITYDSIIIKSIKMIHIHVNVFILNFIEVIKFV